MPTGYTAAIKDGITFKEYAMNCARAFGACIMMRDEPASKEIPEKFEPSDYSKTKCEDAEKYLEKLLNLTESEIKEKVSEKYDSDKKNYAKSKEDENDLKNKYEKMLLEVVSYTAPSEDHTEFKKFMKSQIVSSIEFDCGYVPPIPILMDTGDWLMAEIISTERDIIYHKKAYSEEVERTDKRNLWVLRLRESLKDY